MTSGDELIEVEELESEEFVVVDEMGTLTELSNNYEGDILERPDCHPDFGMKGKKVGTSCFYCDRYLPQRFLTKVSCVDSERQNCFDMLSDHNEAVALRMEEQYQKFPYVSICRDHIKGGSRRKRVWQKDDHALKSWHTRLRWDDKTVMMTEDYVQGVFGLNPTSALMKRCFYCDRRTFHTITMPVRSKTGLARDFSKWLKGLAMGDVRVERILRTMVSGKVAVFICGSHFLRSAYMWAQPYSGKNVKLRCGEIPIGDFSVNSTLLKDVGSKMDLSIIDDDEKSVTGVGQGNLISDSDEADQMDINVEATEDDSLFFKPLKVTTHTWFISDDGEGLRGTKMNYVDVPVDLNQQSTSTIIPEAAKFHRFVGRMKNSMVCIACKIVNKQLNALYKLRMTELKRKSPLTRRGFPPNAFSLWLSEHRDWLKSQMSYGLHQFSTKARDFWENADEEVREKYEKIAQELRSNETTSRLAKFARMEPNSTPKYLEMMPALVNIVNGMLYYNPQRLEHVCVLYNRVFDPKYVLGDGYYPPLVCPKGFEKLSEQLRQERQMRRKSMLRQAERGIKIRARSMPEPIPDDVDADFDDGEDRMPTLVAVKSSSSTSPQNNDVLVSAEKDSKVSVEMQTSGSSAEVPLNNQRKRHYHDEQDQVIPKKNRIFFYDADGTEKECTDETICFADEIYEEVGSDWDEETDDCFAS